MAVLEWNEYIQSLLEEVSVFDSISLTISGELEATCVPPIIKTSILMLDRMIAAQGQYNIFVFPEKAQSAFIFALLKTIHNIVAGKIQKTYNPYSFKKGQKLKIKNSAMEFDRIEHIYGRETIFVKFTDTTYGLPIAIAPFMQLADTNRLSKLSSFQRVFNIREAIANHTGEDSDIIKVLQNYKTHMNSSVFYVSPILSTKEYLAGSTVNGRKIHDVLLLGHTNYDGDVSNLGSGQLSGNPALVLASDLYAVTNAVAKGVAVHSLIIDISNPSIIASQLDKIDELMRMGFPIVCVTDVANSFELQLLIDRGYNTWRWDKDSITTSLYGVSPIALDHKIQHCAELKIEYIITDGKEISDSFKHLYSKRTEVKEQSPQMNKLFDSLLALTYTLLRTITPTDSFVLAQTQKMLSECELILLREQAFIFPATYNDYAQVIKNLKIVFSEGFSFPKYIAFEEQLVSKNYHSICILIPERMDKQSCKIYWEKWCLRRGIQTVVTVMHPSEYYTLNNSTFATTVVVGWLSNNTMKKILYGFKTENYIVLLYDYERRWKNAHTAIWSRALNNENNRTIIKKFLNTPVIDISVTRFHGENTQAPVVVTDEVDEIELVFRENKYRQYVASGGNKSAEETVEALPVNFVGGFLSFYKISHKIVTATDIVVYDEEKIVMKLPSQLQVGDFIIVREADRDLIKEIADTMLKNSGKLGYRELATKWKESLSIECMFSSHKEIYEKLREAGCTKNFPTVRGWIMDDDIIAPQQKEDLTYIAKITEDAILMEMIDGVLDAAREVKNAHIQAGKYLSAQLKKKIVSELKVYGDIDPFNIWEPITLVLEDIGTVRILKVIDIGTAILVDSDNTNRLIEEI